MQQETNVSDLKRKTLTNTLWNFVERAGSQIVSFIVQIRVSKNSSSRRIWSHSISYNFHYFI